MLLSQVKRAGEMVLAADGCGPGPSGVLYASHSQDTPLSQVKRAGNRFLSQEVAVQDQVVDSKFPPPRICRFLR
jgi:hypothetical protein